MSKRNGMTRRELLKGAATAALATAFPAVIPSSALGDRDRPAPSERLAMGFVGVGGQGSGDMGGFLGFPQVQGVAVCDVDKNHRDRAKNAVDGRNKDQGCKAYGDYRELVTRPDIDVVFCATPDHWHAIVTIEAMRNGKDVYCEKPESLTIHEAQLMRDTARKYGRVFSGGSQRVWGDYNWFHRMVRGGAIGEVQHAYVNVGGPPDEMLQPAQPVPEGMDWDMWIGPAPWRPYNKAFHPFNWRGCRDFSGGQTTDWGAHTFGGAMFACNVHETGPVEIRLPDGKDFKQATAVFANGLQIHHGGGWGGIISFEGTKGRIGEQDRNRPAPDIYIPNYKGAGDIFGDFLHCVRTRERPFRDIGIGARTLTVCHLFNIAYWLKRSLKWDPVKEEIVGDPEAARWLSRPKRAPWTI
ncbi:MAG: Gfo/Idh/MocA family oxidoreductase [Planctomycetota bacterium]|nr:Gfo/Idh/MocA family oxidoreductase [Planctomycetota bacterium]